MYRQHDRQNEMAKNAEHMHSLAVMEKVLDEELERLENEYHWNCRKYVYLQALECDSAHLHHLATSIQRSRNLTDMLRTLLEDTFEEKIVFMDNVENQQQQWRMEDENLHTHHVNQEQHQQYNHYSTSRDRCFKQSQKQNFNRLHIKRNRKLLPSLTKVKSQRLRPKMFLLNQHKQRGIKFSRRWKPNLTSLSRGVSEFRKVRYQFSRISYCNKKKGISLNQHLEPGRIHIQHSTDERQPPQEVMGGQCLHFMQCNALSNLTIEISNHRHMTGDSSATLPPVRYQPIENETFSRSLSHTWRQDEMRVLD